MTQPLSILCVHGVGHGDNSDNCRCCSAVLANIAFTSSSDGSKQRGGR